MSGLAVLSLHPASAPVIPAPAETPASVEIPASAETPVSTVIPAMAATSQKLAPPTQYVRVGEKAPKLSAIPSRQQVHEITQLLLSKDCPFTPIDVVHHINHLAIERLLKKKFATDFSCRNECALWMEWSNQRFCRVLNITVPDNAVSASDKLGFVDSIFQVVLQFDLKDPSFELKTDKELAKIARNFPNATPDIIIGKLPVEPVNFRCVLHRLLTELHVS
jgi:hypothetical protein